MHHFTLISSSLVKTMQTEPQAGSLFSNGCFWAELGGSDLPRVNGKVQKCSPLQRDLG